MSTGETLYRQVARISQFEAALESLWHDGLISGELHSGRGEEAVVAGVLAHLRRGDGVAADHRSTPAFVACGTDLDALALEVIGSEHGIGGGNGGHMHLFDRERRIASSGIVGASGPLGCGFALAAQQAGDGGVSVALFGEGATNQGMLLESLNLAVAWQLPLILVCKDDGWSITTRSSTMTGASLTRRAAGFGLRVARVDGMRVDRVHAVAGAAIARARAGGGPTFVHAHVQHDTGHLLGFQLREIARAPARELPEILSPLLRSAGRPGARAGARAAGLAAITRAVLAAGWSWRVPHRDARARARRLVGADVAARIDREVDEEIAAVVARARAVAEEAA